MTSARTDTNVEALTKLANELSRLVTGPGDPIRLFDHVQECTDDDLEWLAREFDRRAAKQSEVAFALRRILIDRK